MAIENVTVGMMVMSFNHYTNEVESKEVVRVFENEVTELTHVTINGVTTTATPENIRST